MPAAIPALAAAAATSVAVEAGIVGVGATLIGAGAALAAAYAMSALNKPRAPDLTGGLTQPGGGRQFSFRQPTPSHQAIVGRVKTGGPWMFAHSAADDGGRADGYFYLQIALAAHRCRAIETVYVQDRFETDDVFDGLVTIGKNLGGDDQVEDALFLADLGAGVFGGHRGRGICNMAARLKGRADAFPNGLPNLAAIVWGTDQVYDPRDGSTGWSNNPALVIAWWKTWASGMALPWSKINEGALIAAANVCDERIRVAVGSATVAAQEAAGSPTAYTGALRFTSANPRALDVGDGVRLTSSGTLPAPLAAGATYYAIPSEGGTLRLATSAANAKAGTAVTITAPGSGTHTVFYWDEARYKINGMFTLDAEKMEIRDQMLTAMAGYAVDVGGQWHIHAGAPAIPARTLTADDLRADFSTSPKRSMRDRFNGVRAVFVNADNFWQPSDAPPLAPSAALLEEDNGVELYQDLRFPFTTSARTVQRLMKIYRERNRRQLTNAFPAKLTAFDLAPLEGVYLDYPRYGYYQAQRLVMGWALTPDGGVDLVLQEDDAAIYDWDSTEEASVSAPQGVTLPDPSAMDAPASLTVTTPTTPEYTRLEVTASEVESIWLDGYDFEYRAAGTTDWISYGRVNKQEGVDPMISVERASPQDFRARAVTQNGTPSVFTDTFAPATPTGPTALGLTESIEVDVDVAEDVTAVQIFEYDSDAFAASTLLATVDVEDLPYTHTGLGDSETHYYWFRAVNAAGNISAQSSSASATTEGGG